MIYSPLSSILRTKEFANAPGTQPSADGQAMVAVLVAGVAGIQPSAGVAGEKFVGFATTQTSAASFLQTTAVQVEQAVVPAAKTISLGRTPIAGTVLVKDSAGTVLAPDSVTGKVVDLTTDGVAGASVTVTYRYLLTVVEARSRNGDVTPGGYAGLTTGSTAVAQSGTIYTDQFDTSADFGAPGETVVLGANGQLTTRTVDADGVAVSCSIVALPTVEYPFLGIDFDTY